VKATIRLEWDMGHRLPNHGGACRNLHGHRYVAEVTFEGDIINTPGASDEGMVTDFQDIKSIAKPLVAMLDHRFMLCDRDPLLETMHTMPGVIDVPFVPTAEAIARWLLGHLVSLDKRVTGLRLFETPTSHVDATVADLKQEVTA